MQKSAGATEATPKAIGPYSLAVWAGDLLFVSGQIPLDPATGAVVAGSAGEQLKQSVTNVRAILKEAGLDLDHVVKTTLFVKDLSEFPAINEAYAACFAAPYPARSCVEVSRLPKDVLVELDVIARR